MKFANFTNPVNDFRVKGKFRIGGALVLGICIILGALYVGNKSVSGTTGSVIVSQAPLREAIGIADSDGDGIQDWEESLQGKVFETIDTPTSTALTEDNESYAPPTTFTGKFSEAFFKDYLQGKIDGRDFTDPTAFIGTAVEAIEQNTQSKRHTRLELTLIQSDFESIHEYGNRVSEIMQMHSANTINEALILQNALTANDPKILEGLKPIRIAYTDIIEDTLRMEVPDAFAGRHVDLLNAYELILTDIEAMQVAFADPLFSLARVKSYEKDAQALYDALKAIAVLLDQNNATYANDEAGAFFYLFDI